MTDPISDMLIRIKNAQRAGHETVVIPHSQFKQDIAKVLEQEGFITKTEKRGRKVKKVLEIFLHPKGGLHNVNGVKIISRPSRRLYSGHKELRNHRSGRGILIVSTSKGVMSSRDAYKAKLGGQLMAEVW